MMINYCILQGYQVMIQRIQTLKKNNPAVFLEYLHLF